MPELTADLFISLDGFAAGTGVGPFFGYPGPELAARLRHVLEQPQLVVMGRVTYQALWKISAAAGDEVSTRMNDLPKVVFSNTLTEPLAWANTRLLSGGLAEGIRALKRRPGDPLRSIGSITLVKSLMQLGLVDLLRVTVFPVVLGKDGREPAYASYPRTGLELVDTKVLDSRLVMLEYRPAQGAAG